MIEEACSIFQDETKLQTNPKIGFCWMRSRHTDAPSLSR